MTVIKTSNKPNQTKWNKQIKNPKQNNPPLPNQNQNEKQNQRAKPNEQKTPTTATKTAVKDEEKGEPLFTVVGSENWLLWKPSVPLLSIYPKDYRDTCLYVFIAALLPVARNWNQFRWPPVDGWTMRTWDTYTTECYSAVKRSRIMKCEGEGTDRTTIILYEIIQTQKDKCLVFSLLGS